MLDDCQDSPWKQMHDVYKILILSKAKAIWIPSGKWSYDSTMKRYFRCTIGWSISAKNSNGLSLNGYNKKSKQRSCYHDAPTWCSLKSCVTNFGLAKCRLTVTSKVCFYVVCLKIENDFKAEHDEDFQELNNLWYVPFRN